MITALRTTMLDLLKRPINSVLTSGGEPEMSDSDVKAVLVIILSALVVVVATSLYILEASYVSYLVLFAGNLGLVLWAISGE